MAKKVVSMRGVTLIALMAMALSGCASVGPGTAPVSEPTKKGAISPQNSWWYARFAMKWPPGAEPSWYVDPLLAQLVVAPVLAQHREELVLWRFHRRAVRDQAGHQFSFIFYASPQTAQEVFGALQADRTLKEMKTRGIIIRDVYDDTSVISHSNIEDSSDRSWSPPVQKAWPYFIMGVSEMWLNLIAEIANQTPGGKVSSSFEEVLGLYKQVNASLEQLWQEEGQHAFLHHLNAIFGYEPVMVREKRLMGF